jgi:nitroreductase
MDRRTFLKSVPAMAALFAAQASLKGDADLKGLSVSKDYSIKTEGLPGGKEATVIKLNEPNMNGGLSLMEALKKRKSTREFTDKRLSLQQLSDLLWAAEGVNRPDGKSPAAMAMYSVDIYVVLPEGVYLYDVHKNELRLVAAGDYRKLAGTQDFVYTAPLNLVYVLDMKMWENSNKKVPEETREKWALFEVGFLVQNVYLYCASEGLGSVVRAGLDRKGFGQLVNVNPDKIALAQTVGNIKS